jgi:hypothetical protein
VRRSLFVSPVFVIGLGVLALGCSDPGTSTGGITGLEVESGDTSAGDSAEPGDGAVADAVDTSPGADVGADSGDTVEGSETSVENGFPYIIVEPEALDFGALPVGGEKTLELELENAGNLPLTMSRVWVTGTSESFATNLSQALVAPGQKKVVKVTFYALREGLFEDVLRFESNAVNDTSLEVPLRGEVTGLACQDQDGDAHGVDCAAGADCNDSDPDVHVGAPEVCDGFDQDCDGLHDEDFVGLGTPCEVGFGACSTMGVRICGGDGVSLKCSVNPVTGGDELCNDLDDDCDGATDEDFPSKGKLCSVGLGACRVVDKYVCSADRGSLVCNVNPLPPGREICNDGIDNDCDGKVDEGELEVCADNVDNDCDGSIDESGSSWGEVFFARNWFAETVAIYPVTPDGPTTFGPAIMLDFPGASRWGVAAVGDFDGDRWLDLVVTETRTEGRQICSIPADCPAGTGCKGGVCRKLCSAANGGATSCPAGETCIDFSAYANDPTDTWCQDPTPVHLARSSCDGGLIELRELFRLEPGEGIGPVIDADQNGHLDFVGLGHWSTKKGFTWLSDGRGNYSKLSPSFDYATMFGPVPFGYWVWGLTKTSKDIDGDGRVDVLGRSFSSGGNPPTDLWLFRSLGDGRFENGVAVGAKFPEPANLLTANDFDRDGDQDIIGGLDDDGNPGSSWILLNRGSGAIAAGSWVAPYPSFDVAPSYNNGSDQPGTGFGTSFDFTGDGYADALAGWIPEECGSYVWGCPSARAGDICYQGNCRKIGLMKNLTEEPCGAGTSCVNGQCVPGCTPSCAGRQCGSDGCGGSCGDCLGGQFCARGQCVVDCVPQCSGRECGDDGCGGVCGDCGAGSSCIAGVCTAGCIPNCSGRKCGDDGCGGRCAVFGNPEIVSFDSNPYINVEPPTNVPPTRPTVSVEPAMPLDGDALNCIVTVASYDLDAVRYRYRWYKNGAFVPGVGERADLDAAFTSAGEQWTCKVWGDDGVERSQPGEATVTIGGR